MDNNYLTTVMDNNYCIDLDKLICRYFLTDGCRDGKSCLFPHVKDNNLVPDSVCRYFLKGECLFGKNCRYDHVILLKGNSTTLRSSHDETLMSLIAFPYGEEDQAIMAMDYMRDCVIYDVVPNKMMMSQQTMLNDFGQPLEYSDFNCAVPHHHLRISVKCIDSKNAHPDMNGKNTGMMGPLSFDFEPCSYGEACPFQNDGTAFGNECQHNELEHRFFDLDVTETPYFTGSLCLSDTDNKTCKLCGDFILHNESKKHCQYGLLQNCQHLFCLECILPMRVKKYRYLKKFMYSNLKIICPECHTLSRNVISSRISMKYAEKKLLFESYRENTFHK